ncbi:MAG: CDP-glycerol glycerophosphotransferase family protein [Chlamydiota bacterium]
MDQINSFPTPPSAGLIEGWAPHYIDHLAPLCCLLGIPLLVTEEKIAETLSLFYPKVSVYPIPTLALPEKITECLEVLFVCTPRILVDELLFLSQALHKKKIHSVWCPHGNSDKGHKSAHMEALDKEEIALVYGKKMIDFLKQKKAFSQLKSTVEVSNFRLRYYLENKTFYDNLLQVEILEKLPVGKKLLLYAPTWQDGEESSSFYEATPHLIKNLPKEWNLIIKPHPNLALKNEALYDSFLKLSQDHPNILFLNDFPPIYPLLSIVDLYIGDFSSIGYDFLAFQKPMFFLNQQKRSKESDLGLYLYQCGTELKPCDYPNLYTIIQNTLPEDKALFSSIRQEVYQYTFAEEIEPGILREKIFSSCTQRS